MRIAEAEFKRLPAHLQSLFAKLPNPEREEVVSLFPQSSVTGERTFESKIAEVQGTNWLLTNHQSTEYQDSGSAARFFYCAKTSQEEREIGCNDMPEVLYGQSGGAQQALAEGRESYQDVGGIRLNRIKKVANNHPTVKPVDLMAYLCRLVTPPGGVVLDPFLGSGSTGIAALRENFDFIGVEISPDYATIAEKRIKGSLPWFQADAVTVVGRIEEPIPAEEGSLFA